MNKEYQRVYQLAAERGDYIKELEAVIAECGCQGEWCGKSPTPKDDGLCAVCKYKKQHTTKEVSDE